LFVVRVYLVEYMEHRDINYTTFSALFNNIVVEIVISKISTIVIRLNRTFMRSIILPVKYVLIYERKKTDYFLFDNKGISQYSSRFVRACNKSQRVKILCILYFFFFFHWIFLGFDT
jgi:hypothetical protein